MEFFSVQINSIVFKSFRTYELALTFVKNNYGIDQDQGQDQYQDQIEIYHEEYPDYDNAHSEAHGFKTLVYSHNKKIVK
jgi:hypothetical protein